MKMDFKYRFIGLLALATILGPPQALADPKGNNTYPTEYSEKSAAVVPDNAQNAACSKYTVGGTQLSIKKPRRSGTVSGSGETANYSLTDGKTNLSFSDASLPIDFVIVRGKKGSKKSLVIHYYSSGVNDDFNIKVLGADKTPLPVVEFALCAKSVETEGTPLNPVTFDLTIPRCGTESTPASPSACPHPSASDNQDDPYLSSKEIVLVKYIPLKIGDDAARFAAPVDERTCFCTGGDPTVAEIENLVQCDDEADAYDPEDAPALGENVPGGSCTLKVAPGAKVQQVTELENDPYFCRTINGRRVCWAY